MPGGQGVQTYLKNSIAQEVESIVVFAPTWTDGIDPHLEKSWRPLSFPFNAAAKAILDIHQQIVASTSTRNS